MKASFFLLTSLVLAAGALPAAAAPKLDVVAEFPHQQVTGVGVSQKSGRVFFNFPLWSKAYTFAVGELTADGHVKPYPDAAWNATSGAPAQRFVCVQSVVADDGGHLWVLDPAGPNLGPVVPGGPKLVEIDLATNKVLRVYPFDGEAAPAKSYLNDVRIDLPNHTAYMTDSGTGAIIVLDLDSGHARALLRDAACTKADPAVKLVIDGKPLLGPDGRTPAIHSDGIAFDAARGLLYFHALTARGLYRVATADLRDASLSETELEKKVVKLADTPMPDGMLECPDGTVLMTDLEHNAVNRFDPATKRVTPVVHDERLQWPDTLAWGPDHWLYVTASQIQRMPRFNHGRNLEKLPYQAFRVRLP